MVLKIDPEKANDGLSWKFIEETLIDSGLPWRTTKVIMSIVSSSWSQLLWNGELTEHIKSRRGLHHKEPLLSLVFVPCMERINQWIQHQVEFGVWKAIKTFRSGLKALYLFKHYIYSLLTICHSSLRRGSIKCVASRRASGSYATAQVSE